MEIIEDQIDRKHGKKCGHCSRNMLLPNEYEGLCNSSDYNMIKRKNELSKNSKKISNIINRLKNAEHKKVCICIDVFEIDQGGYFKNIYEVSPNFKIEKLKVNKILMKKYQNRNENPDFEQNYFSRTATGIYKTGHDSVRLMKW